MIVETDSLLDHGDKGVGGTLGLAKKLRDLADEASHGGRAFDRRLDARASAELLLHPVLHHWLGNHPDVELGIQVLPTPSTTTMVFCRSKSSGRVCMSNTSVYWKSCPSSCAIEISFAGRSRIGSPMARKAGANCATECLRGT